MLTFILAMATFKYSSHEYEPLSSSYFNVPGVPPPLVLKSWLAKVETEIEENLDLALVAKRIKAKNDCVARKRGRPKKLQPEPVHKASADDWFCDRLSDQISEPDWPESQGSIPLDIDTNEAIADNPEPEYQDQDVELNQFELDTEPAEIIPLVPAEKVNSSWSCPLCSKAFKALSTFKYHMRIHNGNLLKCDECGRGFMTKYLLKCHQRVHTGKLFTCSTCNKGFTTAELLKIHQRRHTGERPYSCDQCPKRFPSSSNLKQHKESHLTEKKYLCNECGASFNQRRCLECHMVIHSEKTLTCTVCGKRWARKSDLTEHMRVHTRQKPFQCEICQHRFTQASSLKRHVLTHQQPFDPRMCQLCEKVFRCELYYQRHLQRHFADMQVQES